MSGPNDQNSSARSGNAKSARRPPCSRARSSTRSKRRRISLRACCTGPVPGGEAQEDVLEHAVAGLDREHALEEADEARARRRALPRPPRRPPGTRRCGARRPPRRARRGSRNGGRACRRRRRRGARSPRARPRRRARRRPRARPARAARGCAARGCACPPARLRCRSRAQDTQTGGMPPVCARSVMAALACDDDDDDGRRRTPRARARDRVRRAHARHVPGGARPDDRLDRPADDRRRPRRPQPPLVGRHVVPARVDRLDADLRQARRHVRPQARSSWRRS